ncbi:MAG: anti-sigma factor [Acidimicrobiia bacterium]
MNDRDRHLIVSLLDGALSPTEQEEVRARLQIDAEMRAAYEEQLAVSTTLRSAPAVSMSADERNELHGALRAGLFLDDTAAVAPVAAPARRWSRWWAPLAGLATAAVIVTAVVVLPGMFGGEEAAELLSAPAPQTTAAAIAPSLEADPLADVAEDSAGERQAREPTSTTAAAAAAETAEPDAALYSLAATALPAGELELPVLGDDFDADGVESAALDSTTRATIDYDAAAGCFGSADSVIGEAVLVGTLSVSGDNVVAVITDATTGAETVIIVDLVTCRVTSAGP